MKLTKSELKEMIREALREELAKKPLTESENQPTWMTDPEHEYMDIWKADLASKNRDIQREIDAELNNPEYTKFSITVDGSDKKLEQSNVLYKDALNKILQFISTLTKEEKLNIGIIWFHDNGEGDPVLWLEAPTEAKENLFDDSEWDEYHMDDPLNRILENWDGDYALLCVVKALSDVSTAGPQSSAIKYLMMKYKGLY
jgi:hypothetical protein